MGILNDIDVTLDNTDTVIGTTAERKIDFDTITFDTVSPDSCHYAILKKFNRHTKGSYKVERQIAKYEWECSNLLKYFGLNDIYKGITICLDMSSVKTWGYPSVSSRLVLIYRGHKRKDDFAYLIKSFNASAATTHLREARFALERFFTSESAFNSLFSEPRRVNNIPKDCAHNWLNFYN